MNSIDSKGVKNEPNPNSGAVSGIPDPIVDCLIQANPISFIMTVDEMSFSSYYKNIPSIKNFVNDVRSKDFFERKKSLEREGLMIHEYERAMNWTQKCSEDIHRLATVVSCHRLM